MNFDLLGDVNAKSVYLRLQHKSRGEYSSLCRKLDRILKAKEQSYDYLFARKEDICKTLKINLLDYPIEFGEQRFNEELGLETKVSKLLRLKTDSQYRQDIVQLAKWCSIIRNEHDLNNKIIIAKKKLNLNYKAYENLIFLFFQEVQKVLLQGDIYKMGYGLGSIYLDCVEYNEGSKRIDFAKTLAYKKELIESGNFDEKTDYRIRFNKNKDLYLRIINSMYFTSQKMMKFKWSDYVNGKYRGMIYKEIYDKFVKKEDDVYSMQLSLKRKINLLGYINPGFYLKFKN